jgi:hypothetical protein
MKKRGDSQWQRLKNDFLVDQGIGFLIFSTVKERRTAMAKATDLVEQYLLLVRDLIASKKDCAIVRKIRKIPEEEAAMKFFKDVKDAPSILRWIFCDDDARREVLIGYQKYSRKIGVVCPAPPKKVLNFLNGGKYPKPRIDTRPF